MVKKKKRQKPFPIKLIIIPIMQRRLGHTTSTFNDNVYKQYRKQRDKEKHRHRQKEWLCLLLLVGRFG